MLFKIQFTIIALIGMILLIGIVKKNAILNDRLRTTGATRKTAWSLARRSSMPP